MRRFSLLLVSAALTFGVGLAGGGAQAAAAATSSTSTTCTPDVNGVWTGAFLGSGTHANGDAQLIIIQSDSHPGFEWQVTVPGVGPIASGNGTAYPDMTFKISGTGTPGSFVKTAKATGALTGPCTAPFETSANWSATYSDGTPPASGMASLANLMNQPAP